MEILQALLAFSQTLFREIAASPGLALAALALVVNLLTKPTHDLFAARTAGKTRVKHVHGMLLQIKIELPRARNVASNYSSSYFIRKMEELVNAHRKWKKPFRPFIAVVFDEPKYKEWESLCLDLPNDMAICIKQYIELSRLSYVILQKLQSDEFTLLTPARQIAAMTIFAQKNKELINVCDELQSHYDSGLTTLPKKLRIPFKLQRQLASA